jgi:hypothetical protein
MRLKFATSLLLCFFIIQSIQSQTYFLNGSAEFVGGDCYQLTPALNTQNGTVWYAEQLDLTLPFDLQFQMNFGSTDANGADGICFVLHTQGTSAIGVSGGGMGYLNFGTSLGIEFDTWQNGEYADPTFDHIAIQRNGDINHNGFNNIAGPIQASPTSVNIEDGEDHTVQITWNPATNLIQVFFDCTLRLEGTQDLINEIFNGQSLVWWGFTAATGGASNIHTVCLQENILSVGDSVLICDGGSTQLSVGASADGTYAWTPTETLDDPTSATPIASPTETTTYTCVYTDLCGVEQSADIEVVVGDLILTMPSSVNDIDCNTPSVTINPTINFVNNNSYVWLGPGGTIVGNGLSFTASAPGIYVLTASSNNDCFATEQIEVEGDFTTLPANGGPDQVINCIQTQINLSAANAGANASYQWNNGASVISNSANTSVTSPGTYNLIVTNTANGCTSQDNIVIGLDTEAPEVEIALQDTLDCLTRALAISGLEISNVNNFELQWSTNFGSFVSGVTTNSPIVNQPGIYSVTVTSLDNGCQGFAEVIVAANEYFFVDLSDLRFPNIITPNGDALNNNWRPFIASNTRLPIMQLFDVYNLKVYNRWGALIEELTRPNVWSPGEIEDGIYYYILDYSITCGEKRQESIVGDIHLVR